jgi:hypothetical protein
MISLNRQDLRLSNKKICHILFLRLSHLPDFTNLDEPFQLTILAEAAEGVPTAAFPEAREWDECVLLGKFTSLYIVNSIPEVAVFVDLLCFFRSHIHSHFLKDSLNDRANVPFHHEGSR